MQWHISTVRKIKSGKSELFTVAQLHGDCCNQAATIQAVFQKSQLSATDLLFYNGQSVQKLQNLQQLLNYSIMVICNT